jgi:protein TonB
MSSDLPRNVNRRPLSLGQTLLIASALEAILVLGSGGLILNAMARSNADPEKPLEIVFEEPPKETLPEDQPQPKPEPKVQVKSQPVPVPVVPTAPALPTPPVVLNVPLQISRVESPIVEAQAPVAPSPPTRTNQKADREAEFAAQVKAAIQSAVIYPPAARSMGFSGRARVEFVLRDGVPGKIKIIQGSSIGSIDRAALAAVSIATYPATPDSLAGKEQTYQVTVLFELNSAR